MKMSEEERKRQEALRNVYIPNSYEEAAIIAAFGKEGIDADTAQKIILLVAGGRIPGITIRY